MKKKKILALVLAASMAGGMLAGCGATSSGDETVTRKFLMLLSVHQPEHPSHLYTLLQVLPTGQPALV